MPIAASADKLTTPVEWTLDPQTLVCVSASLPYTAVFDVLPFLVERERERERERESE